jgi:hypothetical protein
MTAIRGLSADLLGRGTPGQEPAREYRELRAAERAAHESLSTAWLPSDLERHYALERKRQKLVEALRAPKFKPGDVVEHRTGERAVVTGTTYTDSDSGPPRLIYRILRGQEGDVSDMWHAESVVRKVPKSHILKGAKGQASVPYYKPHYRSPHGAGFESVDEAYHRAQAHVRRGVSTIDEAVDDGRPSLPPGTTRG